MGPVFATWKSARAQRMWLAFAAMLCLAPFLGKALHIDDPIFFRVAQQIQHQPLDFFGFEMNWHGFSEPVVAVDKNPPGSSFYLAAVGSLLGWSEPALHLGMWLPTLLLLWGVFALAQRVDAAPAFATLAVLVTPVFLVSATTLMTDVPMLALWCWAIVLWLDGSQQGDSRRLAAAALLAGLAFWTKYYGLAVVPLLAVYSLVRERRLGAWAVHLCIPVAMVAAYQLFVWLSYGVVPLGDVTDYALVSRGMKAEGALREQGLVGIFFLGGCFVSSLFFAPWLWSRRVLLGAALAFCAFLAALPALESIGPLELHDADGPRWTLVLQAALFGACGVQALALAAVELHRRRTPEAWLLACWLYGVFVFAAFANRTASARAVLPAAPALGVLLAWRLARKLDPAPALWLRRLAAPVAAGLAISMSVVWADWKLAESARTAAEQLHHRWAKLGEKLWYQGAWGFDHYLHSLGAERLDFDRSDLQVGDILLVPTNNSVKSPPQAALAVLETVSFPAAGWIATMATPLGAGFYADIWGPLPFAIGNAPEETYVVFGVKRPLQLRRLVARAGPP